jgi:hypothetical protein
MMRGKRWSVRLWCATWLATLAIAVYGALPAGAANPLISVASANDLMLPARLVPPGLSWEPSKSGPIGDAMLVSLAGHTVQQGFRRNGWVTGYHGWLTGKPTAGAPFATYDAYGFATDMGARLSRTAYQNTVLGTPLEYPNDALPKSATVWTDTGTYGNNQPFFVAEIVFRVANVLVDVTGFMAGSSAEAANGALQEATDVTVALTHWLGGRLPASPRRGVLPLTPLLATPAALGRLRRPRRRERR